MRVTRINSRVVDAICAAEWAILPEKLRTVLALVSDHAAGVRLTPEAIRAELDARAPEAGQRQIVESVQVIPVFGMLSARQSLMTEYSGGTSAEMLSKQLRAALADPQIAAIVLDINSPGGTVSGTAEFASEVFAARDRKPILAMANDLAASAAYWIGSAATEFWATPRADVGSIGVFQAHTDISQANAQEGVKMTLISAGRLKVATNPYEPLSEEGRALIQGRVDDAYAAFTSAVAKSRGVPVGDVRSGFGEGAVVSAKPAKALGMIDQIGSMDAAISRASGLGRQKRQAMNAWNESHLLRV